ncbi:hypothetical protein WJX77_002929 [Trebouxia sp. C0004]
MRCFSNATREQNLTVYADVPYASSFTGVELHQYHPSNVSLYSPLLYFEGDYSITLTDSHLSNINTSNWTALPQPLSMFSNAGSVNITNMFSSNYTIVEGALLQFNVFSPAIVWISDSLFSNAFTAVQHSSVSMTNTIFEHVTQTSIITQVGTSVDISNCNFSNGGLLYISAPCVTVHQSHLHNNTAETDGQSPEDPPGGGSLSRVISGILMTCAFTSNTAQGDGRACTFNGGTTVLASNHFELNHAGSHGGTVAYTYQCLVPGSPDDTFPWTAQFSTAFSAGWRLLTSYLHCR